MWRGGLGGTYRWPTLSHVRFDERGVENGSSRYGLHACRVALTTSYTRGFSSLVASTAGLIATGVE